MVRSRAGATAIPAFADSGDNPNRVDSANSLPRGFYDHTPFGVQSRMVEQHFANKGASSWGVQRGVTAPVPPQNRG